MICKNCGAQLPDGTAFCTNCGCAVEAPQQQAQPQYQQAQPQYQQPYQAQPQYQQPFRAQPVSAQPNTLVFGILSLVFSCLFYTAIVGMILGIVGRSKAKAYAAQGGQLTGASKVGSILSMVGMILGIVLSVILLIVIIIAIAASV